MKKNCILLVILALTAINTFSQDSLYLYQGGTVLYKRSIADVDSITFQKNYNLPLSGTVTDIDGNTYNTISIGSQVWMTENLRTTRYRNGQSIDNLTLDADWGNTAFGAWCNINNDASVDTKFGKLYNWYAVNNIRNIAPVGWHVASDAEWTQLSTFLGGESVAGGKMKETGTVNWLSPNTDATNSSLFTARPGGFRYSTGTFIPYGSKGMWWTTTESNSTQAWQRYMSFNSAGVTRVASEKGDGKSVRCLKGDIPLVNTSDITGLTASSASYGGNVTEDWTATVTARGICWNTSPTPNIANSKTTDGTGKGTFSGNISGLAGNTTYYLRAYATNSYGTSYGNEVSFTTLTPITAPLLTTSNVISTGISTASCGGNISTDGGAVVTSRGVCWSSSPGPTLSNSKTIDGRGIGSFTSALFALSGGVTYYVRAYATNSVGTSYGNEVMVTFVALPVPVTLTVSSVSTTSASCNSIITDDGGTTITARGVCWSTTPAPTIANSKTTDGSGKGFYISSLTGLSEGTSYYVRSYSISSAGTAYGNELTFITNQTDIDGNVYHCIKIGNQVWMQENLKTTRYRNGDNIPNVTDNTEWSTLTTGAWCYYNNDANIGNKYGKLYNWYTVNDSRFMTPIGWHVPTIEEWNTLSTFLGGDNVSGGKLKEAGTINWNSPNTGATNESGFSSIPGGYRYFMGTFDHLGNFDSWWSSDLISGSAPINFGVDYLNTYFNKSKMIEKTGNNIRCIRDN